MPKLFLYNTLSKTKEEFKPIKVGQVGLYTCGPTVYNYAHIGNLRTYIFEDILKRVLVYNGYNVKHVMNITDVGHLSGDGDMGEDKLEKGAKREGKSAWDIADFYTKAFEADLKNLNIIFPDKWTKATEYISEQIELIMILEKKGYTYQTSDGIYYDTSKFKDYNKLSHLDLETLQEGARVEINEEKKNPTDFALWKFSPKDEKRQMEWESPWGTGFPGWHVECSAMSKAELGDMLDIHCGGIDHINVHHTNEIAQSEAAYPEQKFFNFWMHGAFLNIAGGKKMAKSEGNFLTLQSALVDKGYLPLAYRYAALSVHYRKPMEWSEESITNSQYSLNKINAKLRELYQSVTDYEFNLSDIDSQFKENFLSAINDDLNMPQAISVMYEVIKSDLSNIKKLSTVLDFDSVLGLKFKERMVKKIKDEFFKIPNKVKGLVEKRDEARREKNWQESDRLRDEIEGLGYLVEDGKDGVRITKK